MNKQAKINAPQYNREEWFLRNPEGAFFSSLFSFACDFLRWSVWLSGMENRQMGAEIFEREREKGIVSFTFSFFPFIFAPTLVRRKTASGVSSFSLCVETDGKECQVYT